MDSERDAQRILQTRLLSHRLRGFGPAEGSIYNLKKAIAAGVRLVEVDTRHTQDAEIVVHHAPMLGMLTTGVGELIKDMSLQELLKATFRDLPGERVATLEEFLDVVRQTPDLEAWIDIKDFGLEERYAELVRNNQLLHQVRLISWIPQTLLCLHQLDSEIKLGFSYACTSRHRGLHRLMRAISMWTGRQSKPLFGGFRLRRWPDLSAVIPYFHPIVEKMMEDVQPAYALGHNHSHFIPGLPEGQLLQALIANRGMVGMFANQATRGTVRQAHEMGLVVYVYSVDTRHGLAELLATSPVDIVFCNNADLILEQANSARMSGQRSFRAMFL